MLAAVYLIQLNSVIPFLLAQDGVTRVSARSSSGMVIDIIIVVALVCAALFGICRSSMRR